MIDSLAAARYSRLQWNTPLTDEHASLLLDLLEPGGRIVDLGCGWGELLMRAVARGGTGIGVDTEAAALDRGRRATAARGLPVEFVSQPAESWHGTADRALCVGSSHALGGTREMLTRLAALVPHGRVLVGDGCWAAPPTPAALELFGDDVLPLAELATACADAGWQILHLGTADQREWDVFESAHRAGQREWLLTNSEDPRAAEVRALHEKREREYLTVYRGVLGFAYLILAR